MPGYPPRHVCAACWRVLLTYLLGWGKNGAMDIGGRGRLGKEWTTVKPNREIKLVRVSGGTSRALSRAFLNAKKGFWAVVSGLQ